MMTTKNIVKTGGGYILLKKKSVKPKETYYLGIIKAGKVSVLRRISLEKSKELFNY